MAEINQSITKFKSNIINKTDLARPNLFTVNLDFPAKVKGTATANKKRGGGYIDGSDKLGKFMVRAAQLPSSTIGVVEVPFRGRMLKIAGDRTFEPWTVTIMNDQDYRLRSAFEVWIGLIQQSDINHSELSTGELYKTMKVTQLSRQENASIVTYKFQNAYPSAISAIDLDWGSNDAIQEFTVEFQISHWTESYASNKKEDADDGESKDQNKGNADNRSL